MTRQHFLAAITVPFTASLGFAHQIIIEKSSLRPEERGICFFAGKDYPQTEVLWIGPTGDFFVKGKLVANDAEVFAAFKQWLHQAVPPTQQE